MADIKPIPGPKPQPIPPQNPPPVPAVAKILDISSRSHGVDCRECDHQYPHMHLKEVVQ